jgi:hypothetical protein
MTGGMRKSEDERRTEALIGNEDRRSGEEEDRSRTGGQDAFYFLRLHDALSCLVPACSTYYELIRWGGGGGEGLHGQGTPLGIVLLTFLISGFSFLPCTLCVWGGGGGRGVLM